MVVVVPAVAMVVMKKLILNIVINSWSNLQISRSSWKVVAARQQIKRSSSEAAGGDEVPGSGSLEQPGPGLQQLGQLLLCCCCAAEIAAAAPGVVGGGPAW